MALHYSPKIITDGLVLALDAANTKSYPGSGTSINDLSRNVNPGTLINGPTFNSGNGGSIVFDDTNDYINLGNTSILNFQWNDPHSIEVWLKRSNSGSAFIYGKNLSSGTFAGTEFSFNASNLIYYMIRNSNTVSTRLFSQSSSTYTDGLWHQFIVTYDGSGDAEGINLYVDTISDSNVINNGNITGGITSSAIACIGAGNGARNFFGGNIAITKVYNRVLSSSEILQNYNSTKSRFI
jgi:hypothetical protein